MMKMVALPKPPKSKAAAVGPKLIGTDVLEIGGRIGESIEFAVEVGIMIFAHKRYESFTGVVKDIENQRGFSIYAKLWN